MLRQIPYKLTFYKQASANTQPRTIAITLHYQDSKGFDLDAFYQIQIIFFEIFEIKINAIKLTVHF